VLAYPYGAWNAPVANAASRLFRWACTTEFQALEADAAPMALPRLDMFYFQRPGSLDDWGTRRFRAGITARHRLRRARAWASAVRGGRRD